MVSNGAHASGVGGSDHAHCMNRVFPEARKGLKEADPEVYAIVRDEKRRQW